MQNWNTGDSSARLPALPQGILSALTHMPRLTSPQIEPEAVEDYIEYLVSVERYQEAAQRLADLLNDEYFVSEKGLSNHQLWVQLCNLLSQHSRHITGLKADAIMREGIRRFTNEVGRLWVALAEYYIRLGNFEKVLLSASSQFPSS
jgi:hypothetical protein